MKRRAHQHASGSPHGTGLQQLEGLPLRLIALKLSDPGPLALSCTAAHRSITSGGDFDDEWFLRWVHALVPLRPWQYAAVGWSRLGGQHATAEQLCAFILRISAAKHAIQQEQDALCAQHASTAPPAATAAAQGSPEHPDTPAQQGPPGPAQQQQQQQPHPDQQDAPDPNSTTKPALQRRKFSTLPHLAPIPSVLRQARKLLAKGDAVRALALLCPGHAWVLHQYAAAAGNTQLLEQLISNSNRARGDWFYPCQGVSVSGGGCRMLNVAQAAAYAAMRAGHTSVLAMLLLSGGASIRSSPHQLGQLFRFAVRHSNAACVQQLLSFAPCMDHNGSPKLTPWPQHLAMAAARVDPWAGEMVSLLLRVTPRKLLAAKYMGPVYGAACRTGHIPGLQQLVQHLVERCPAAHWPVLLRAAAVAGNRSIWQQLLGQQEEQQQDHQEPAADGAAAAAVLPGAWSAAIPAASQAPAAGTSSTGGGLLSYLSRWFTSQPTLQHQPQQHQQQPESQAHQQPQQEQQGIWQLPQLPLHCLSEEGSWPVLLAILDGLCILQRYAGQEGLGLEADSDRLAMADTFWQLLGQQGWQDTVRTAAQQQLCADVAPWASYGGVQQLLAKAPHNKLVWMLQHDMLPQLPGGWLVAPAAAEGLKRRIQLCMKYNQRQAAAVLWQLSKRLRVQVPVRALVLGCLDGEVHRAATAHRIGDLQQQAVLFAEYHASLCWDGAAPQSHTSDLLQAQLNPLRVLLAVLSSVWNTAAVMYTRGLPQQLGIPWQQHLRLCASAVLPSLLQALLPGVPSSALVRMVEVAASLDLSTPDGVNSMAQVVVQLCPLLRQSHDKGQDAAAAAASDSQSDVDSQSDSRSALAGLLKCSLQLAWMCQKSRAEGVKGLILPVGAELTYLPMGSAAVPGMLLGFEGGAQLFTQEFTRDLLCDMRFAPVVSDVHDSMAAAMVSLGAVVKCAAAAAAADSTAASALQQDAAQSGDAPAEKGNLKTAAADRPLSTSERRTAAAAAAALGLKLDTGSGQQAATAARAAAAEGMPVLLACCKGPLDLDTDSFLFTLRSLLTFASWRLPASAAAAAAVVVAATSPPAAAVATAQQQVVVSAASRAFEASVAGLQAPTAASPPAGGMAPAAQGSTAAESAASSSSSSGRVNTVPPLWQLAALALPVSEGNRPLSADPDTALQAVLAPSVERSHTPAFLAGCCSSEAGAGSCSDSGSAVGVPAAAGLVAGPAPPPEHEMLKLVLGDAVWLRHVACTWCGSLHRTDAAAWALHPRQEHLWAHPLNRQLLAMFLKSSMSGLLSGYRANDPLLVRAHEQQLRRHQEVQAAGLTWGDVSSSRGGVLPYFVAGAADAATALLADTQPVAISRLVQMLGGGSSVACIEHVKGALAAVLATPADQIKAVDATWDEGWVQVTVGAIRKASEVGDMDLLALLALLDVQAWCIRPSNSWADGGW